MNGGFQVGAFQPSFQQVEGETPAPPIAAVVSSPSGVKRAFVEIKGRLREVEGYAEAERLLRSLKKEEKALEQDRRKLKIHLKTVESAPVTGVLYRKAQERVQVIEARMDERLEKISELHEAIQKALDEQEDEEILLLI